MSLSQHWHSKDVMSGRQDMKDIKYNDRMVTCGICQNFNNAAGNCFAVLKEDHNGECSDEHNELTCKGDFAKIHDPVKHLSSDCATANRHCVHRELASSEVQLRALAPCVKDQGMYIWLSTFLLAPCLSGSSLKEPRHHN